MDNNLVLPKDYLNCFYDPPDAKAKIFIVHPSHRYAGIFRGMAAGMKYQVSMLLELSLLANEVVCHFYRKFLFRSFIVANSC